MIRRQMQWPLWIFSAVVLTACAEAVRPTPLEVEVLTNDSMAYCESVLVDGERLLVCNFGTEELNPLNAEGKGSVLAYTDGRFETFIPADGTLSAPKGTLIAGEQLFIADVGKIAVYDLTDLQAPAQVVRFPEGELFVNDLTEVDDTLYVTVTNTGHIYRLDISDPAQLDAAALQLYATVPGANGIVHRGDTLYVASYPPDGVTTDQNVIYRIALWENSRPEKLIDRPGQYDGLALDEVRNRLYFTNWVAGEVGFVNLSDGTIQTLDLSVFDLQGPARMVIQDSVLYIPDLPTSRILKVK